MYEWRNAKVSGNVRKAFEIATDIAWQFDDEKIRSAYVLFAALNDVESVISKCFGDMDIMLVPDLEYILNNKEMFSEIFGVKAAEKLYAQDQAIDDNAANEGIIKNEDLGLPNDEITNKVLNVLNGLINVTVETEYGDYDGAVDLIVPVYSDKLEKACDDAFTRCKAMKLDYINLDVLIYCILQDKETSAYKFMKNILGNMEIDIDEFINSLKISANVCDVDVTADREVIVPQVLTTCIEALNKKYTKGEESVILGRDKEIFKAFNIFSKKTKRNAVLVGDPGVGKTAIIEAITQAIVNETCPKEFIGYTVLSLDINAMVAGTKYRGEFETKVAYLKQFLEITPKIILFVDEMHQMLGAGGTSEGTVDLSGSLKPILSRDDVVFVGATTINEYNSILSRDGAFKRRFEVITIKEPKNNEVKDMIKAKIKKMEKYHGVKMPGKLIDYIILCSSCFNFESCNPDKTLDLCDRSMAITKMSGKKTVTKAYINKVYDEFFEKYEHIDKKQIAATAYHEIGHYLVTRLTKEYESHSVTAISIIPTNEFLGVNIIENRENVVSIDNEYVESYIMSLLAGRVAQQKISKSIDSGAANDLKQAKIFAKHVIAEYGMDDEEYKNIYLMDDDLMSDKLAEKIDEKSNQLIKKLYAKTEEFINLHWNEIDKMAKYIMKNKIVTSDELEQFINK